jgi:hypothetical protein
LNLTLVLLPPFLPLLLLQILVLLLQILPHPDQILLMASMLMRLFPIL